MLLLALGVVALAAFLRFLFFDLMEFKIDEVRALRLAERALTHGVPRTGMLSGVGVPNPPGFIQALMPAALVGFDPLLTGAWIALLNLAAVALLVLAGRRLGSPRAGLWAGALMAAHPWLVLFSRKPWAQSLLPLLVTLLLLAVIRCMRVPRSRAVCCVPPLIAFAWQVHYSAYAVLAFGLAWLANELRLRRLHVPMALAGVVVAALIASPYLRHLLETDFADLKASLDVGTAGAAGAVAADSVANWARTAFAGGLGAPFRATVEPLDAALGGARGVLLQLLALLATGLVLGAAGCAWLRPRTTRWLLLLAVLPLALYLLRGIRSPPHDFLPGLPPLLLLAGLGLDRLGRRRPWLGWLPGLAILGAGTLLVLTILLEVRREGGTAGDYGTTYAVQRQVAALLVEHDVDLRAVDARPTRDQSVGVFHLIEHWADSGPFVPGRQARIVDRLLAPALDCAPEADTTVLQQRVGPLQLCIIDPPPP